MVAPSKLPTPAPYLLRASLLRQSEQERAKTIASLPLEVAEALLYDWAFWARPEQLPPDGDWRVWLVMAGRGFGKTRTGAEWVRAEVEAGRRSRLALVSPTSADARDVMIEGESGLLAISNPKFRPTYEPSKRRLTWPNGAIATTYSADEPERLRGPQHDGAWCDEPASWRYPEAWDMLMFGLRLGSDPRTVVTGTPKPVALIRELVKNPTTHITRGKTLDNRANLARQFMQQIMAKYAGTRLGRQELDAELLEDTPGALWTLDRISGLRIALAELPELVRVVVAIDPAVTSSAESDETGIVVAGVARNGHAYVLEDCTVQLSPHGWASTAIAAYRQHKADRIVAETNNGGEMVEYTLRSVDANIPYTAVHASRGKRTRAEPIAALYEQGRVHHVGVFDTLEDQMCTWTPGQDSPDRMDALVWALTDLLLDGAQYDWGLLDY